MDGLVARRGVAREEAEKGDGEMESLYTITSACVNETLAAFSSCF